MKNETKLCNCSTNYRTFAYSCVKTIQMSTNRPSFRFGKKTYFLSLLKLKVRSIFLNILIWKIVGLWVILTIQNRVLRLLLRKGPRTSIEWMLNAPKIMSVKQRVCFNTLVLIFKIKNNMLLEYMSEEVQYNRDATERVLRNTNDFRLPKYNKRCTHNSMWHDGLKLFNELQTVVKIPQTSKNSKKRLNRG
jgi:hypothetical protein